MGCTCQARFEAAGSLVVRHARVLRDGELASESTVQTPVPTP